MLVIAATIPIRREKIEEAVEAAIAMTQASRAEDGCIEYAFSQDLENPALFRVIEKWESLEALQAHFRTPHMEKFSSMMGEFVAGAVEARRFDVAHEAPVMSD